MCKSKRIPGRRSRQSRTSLAPWRPPPVPRAPRVPAPSPGRRGGAPGRPRPGAPREGPAAPRSGRARRGTWSRAPNWAAGGGSACRGPNRTVDGRGCLPPPSRPPPSRQSAPRSGPAGRPAPPTPRRRGALLGRGRSRREKRRRRGPGGNSRCGGRGS